MEEGYPEGSLGHEIMSRNQCAYSEGVRVVIPLRRRPAVFLNCIRAAWLPFAVEAERFLIENDLKNLALPLGRIRSVGPGVRPFSLAIADVSDVPLDALAPSTRREPASKSLKRPHCTTTLSAHFNLPDRFAASIPSGRL